MRHIIKYELNFNKGKYEVGDYVVININKVKNSYEDFFSSFDNEELNKYVYVKITDIINNGEFPLKIQTSLGSGTSVNKDEIERYMTPDEIEKYEIEKNANKYNL